VKYTVSIVILSDKGSRGEREDRTGPRLKSMLEEAFDVQEVLVIPDDLATIVETLKDRVDRAAVDLIVTSGGTGLSKRDVTPEATRAVIERDLPGFAEVMRARSTAITPHGIISRAICGTRKETIIINLPGSPKGAAECLSFVLDAVPHALSKLKGNQDDCAVDPEAR
jgi:molybdopterin adenylyltransferase